MDYEKLMGAAIRFVSYRPRSEKEIRDFLEKKLQKSHTSAPTLLDKVIARLAELGYVDDAKFAAWWIEQRSGRKPKGAKLVVYELKEKGIKVSVERDEKALAAKALAGKKVLDKKKAIDFLMRRGFSWEVSARVVDERFKNE